MVVEVALTRLVESEGDRLYSLSLRFCGHREEAEDLVQETFLQAYRKWSQFQGRSSPGTWLYTIASRLCQRMHRRKVGEPQRLESLDALLPFAEARMAVVPGEDDGPLAREIREEGRREIEAAIAGLPMGYRMPLVLKEVAGIPLAEIGDILGLKEATVKTRLHRARLHLRKALESALPTREVPPPAYSKQVCLDLMQAKQEALDRGVVFEFPDQMLCERCAELFATLDLSQAVCRDVARGKIPERLRRELLARIGHTP